MLSTSRKSLMPLMPMPMGTVVCGVTISSHKGASTFQGISGFGAVKSDWFSKLEKGHMDK